MYVNYSVLFFSIFDSLSKMEYDPELFGKALPCLTAIACALPPDYAKSKHTEDDLYSANRFSSISRDTARMVCNLDILRGLHQQHMQMQQAIGPDGMVIDVPGAPPPGGEPVGDVGPYVPNPIYTGK